MVSQGLVVRDLAVSYGAVPAVRGVSLECKPGEILGVVGPNGAGKTSLLSGIAGLVRAKGSVHLDGDDITRWPAHRRGQAGVVFVAERRRTFPSLSVKENLAVGGWGLDKEETEARVQEVYQLFPRLKEREEVPSFRLSGGEQRMVSIGRALVTGARCILFDELSLGLAPRIVSMLTETVRELADQGRMVVLVEQYIGVLLRLADHVHVLERGRSIHDGAPHDTALFLEEHGYLAHQDVRKVEAVAGRLTAASNGPVSSGKGER
jgi:branched-chain amino acid transport system ATP-binding protein